MIRNTFGSYALAERFAADYGYSIVFCDAQATLDDPVWVEMEKNA